MKKIHYGWAVCFCAMLLIFCNMGFINNGFSVCLPYVEEQGGFSGMQGSMIISVRCASSLISTFFVTKYYKKVKMRKGVFIATLMSALAYFTFSLGGRRIMVYYLGAVIAGVSYAFGTTIPMSILINNWFVKRRGVAIGIATCGTAFCTMIFPPIITAVIQNVGLGAAFRVESAFVLLCAVLIFIIVRERPEDMGMLAYGDGEQCNIKAPKKSWGSRNMMGWEWAVMVISMIFVGAVSTTGSAHFSVIIKMSGFSPEQTAAVVSFWGVTLIGGKFLYGYAADHMGGKKSTVLFYSFYILGCCVSWLFLEGNVLWCYVFALLIGFGIPPATVGLPIWAAELSKEKDYAGNLRWCQMFFLSGGVIFTSMPGLLYDHLGNYQSAYMVLALFTVLGTAGLCLLYARFKKHP